LVVLVLEVADGRPGLEQTLPVVAVQALPPETVAERFDVAARRYNPDDPSLAEATAHRSMLVMM
jgi:hypothetical protein